MNDDFLDKKLSDRKEQNAFRTLASTGDSIDFCSNDYLGIVKNGLIPPPVDMRHGSTGSRLLTGNYRLIEETELFIAGFHNAPSGLIFNSGYDANIGLFSCVPQKGDTIIYDAFIHASVRDGIRLSSAESVSFLHNHMGDLEKKLEVASHTVFVVTESIFSMDGQVPPLQHISDLCERYNANLIVDEAHATGFIGEKGEGLVQRLQLQKKCFARIHTFGKACGAHGAIILGSERLKNYLINFSRPFIYTTALPPVTVACIRASYEIFPALHYEREHLRSLIGHLQNSGSAVEPSDTPIQVVIIAGNYEVKKIAMQLQKHKLDVRPILYPSVPKGMERLRIVLHSFNTAGQLNQLSDALRNNGYTDRTKNG